MYDSNGTSRMRIQHFSPDYHNNVRYDILGIIIYTRTLIALSIGDDPTAVVVHESYILFCSTVILYVSMNTEIISQ